MHTARSLRRALLLATALVSLCAAGPDPTGSAPLAVTTVVPPDSGPPILAGAYSAFLVARFAAGDADVAYAAPEFLKALAADPHNPDLIQQAFAVCVMAGRPEAAKLAMELPGHPVASLLLIDNDVRAGNWDAAERRVRALPDQGITQVLQPLLLAWVQQGAGHPDAALATLRAYAEGPRFRGVYALHAALIADLAGRTADAAKLYRATQTDYEALNLRLGQILASWQARQGHLGEAQRILDQIADASSGDMSLALPSLIASSMTRPIGRASDGIAESYLALAAALRQQDANDFAMLLLRLALDLRPDLVPARMLMADIMEVSHHPEGALAIMAPVPDNDPLAAVVRLNRAMLNSRIGHTDEALRQLERLAHDYPDSAVPDIQAGDVLRDKSRYQEAIVEYDRALARNKLPSGEVWPVLYARGVAYERAHQWPKAEADFKRALELAPNQPIVLNYLGYSWADQGMNLPQARQMIGKALEQRPNDGAIIDSLGWVTLRQGDPQGAVKLLEHAVELEPEDATINGHLGDAYWAVGRRLEATFQWRRALTLNPEPEDAARIEVRLHDTAALTDPPSSPEHRIQ